jgi:hypothetical protein
VLPPSKNAMNAGEKNRRSGWKVESSLRHSSIYDSDFD